MAEEIYFGHKRISNFDGLITLTLDQITRHTII